MTHIELKELLINRIGWKQPLDSVITVDADNLVTESGRYFQDEYPSITISNIKEAIPMDNPSESDINTYLGELKKSTILLVLADVFRVSDIQENVITNRLNLFDNAISKRMAISVGELIINTGNSSRTNRINKEIQQKVFFELNGNADSASSRANENFPTYVGLKSRYGAEIIELRDLLEQDEALDTFTYRVPSYTLSEFEAAYRSSSSLDLDSLGGFLMIS